MGDAERVARCPFAAERSPIRDSHSPMISRPNLGALTLSRSRLSHRAEIARGRPLHHEQVAVSALRWATWGVIPGGEPESGAPRANAKRAAVCGALLRDQLDQRPNDPVELVMQLLVCCT